MVFNRYNTIRVFKNSAAKKAKEMEIADPSGHSKSAEYRHLLSDNPEANTRKALHGEVPQDTAVWSG